VSIGREHFRQAMQHTPFHERIVSLSRTDEWTSWNGYAAARVIDTLSSEYFAIRSGCALMDITPMEKYRILGKGARDYLNRLLTRDISKLRPGRVSYVVWCNDEGKVIDDGTLFQLGESDYRLCAQHHNLDWLLISASGFDVRVECETHEIAALAVQGPTSYSVLTEAGIENVGKLKPFDFAVMQCRGIPVTVSRTGYTGDLGYELWVDPEKALSLWDSIFGIHDHYDIRAMGLSALEMARIEAGFIMPGFDFNTAGTTIRDGYDRSPYEVGLGWVVSLNKGHFTGRRALIAENSRPARRRLTGIIVDGNKPLGEALIHAGKNGRQVGEIKCAIWSPILKANLALADIEYAEGQPPARLWARIEYRRELKWMSTWVECRAVTSPFYRPSHRAVTPPPDF
jgi:aminomethyltransferase